MKKLLVILCAGMLALSCGNNHDGASAEVMYEADAYDQSTVSAATSQTPAIETPQTAADKKKVIKEGRMGIKVGDVHKARGVVDGVVARYGGYYAQDSFNDSGHDESYTLVIRIPNADYEKLIADIEKGGGKVLYKEINARDVSEAYYDVQTRLANKRVSLQRYRELVKQARNIEEVLEVEEYIRRLEEEIESAEGRLRFLSDQVAYSTLALTLTKYKDYVPVERETFWGRLKESARLGWRIIVEIFLLAVKLWPILIIAAVALLLWRRNNLKRKKSANK